MTITAQIWWDDQDPQSTGWAWTTRVNGDHDDSGPLDGCPADAGDTVLIAALRQALTTDASDALLDDDVEIVR